MSWRNIAITLKISQGHGVVAAAAYVTPESRGGQVILRALLKE